MIVNRPALKGRPSICRGTAASGSGHWPGGLLFASILLASLAWPPVAEAQKLVIVVRHAERADGGAGTASMTGAPADPLLSAAGEARAARLAGLLAESGITAIFATEFKRTQDTAKPIAAKLGLTTQTVKAADTAGLLAALKASHGNDIVLIVGHSNTMPEIIKGLTGRSVTIADSQYDDLFFLVPASGTVARIKY